MKFRVERELLTEALGAAARVASSRNNAMPALSGVHMQVKGDSLVLTCICTPESAGIALLRLDATLAAAPRASVSSSRSTRNFTALPR
ncbi:MAG: hypothetical protein ACKO6O_06895 [Acidimicrobiaceae bacterium]